MDQAPKSKRGGKRPGAGRPPGVVEVLGRGEVKAIRAARLRVPEGIHPAAEEMAQRALERIVDVMEERVHHTQAGGVLKAATRLREEACGPLLQKVALTDPTGEGPLQVVVQTLPAGDE